MKSFCYAKDRSGTETMGYRTTLRWITTKVSDGLSRGMGFEVHTFSADAEGCPSSLVMFQPPKLYRYDGVTSQKTDEQTKNPMESSSEGALFQTQGNLYLLSK